MEKQSSVTEPVFEEVEWTPEQKEIIDRTRAVWRALFLKHSDLIIEFVNDFRLNVPDWRRYKLLEILMKSSFDKSADLFDGEGKYSILGFVERMEKQFGISKKEE